VTTDIIPGNIPVPEPKPDMGIKADSSAVLENNKPK
jgi:hypothetical protein